MAGDLGEPPRRIAHLNLPKGITFVSMPKRELGSVRDAWQQFMWILNTAGGERVSMLADFRNGYDRAISYLLSKAKEIKALEMVLMLDSDIQPEIPLKKGIELARESFELGYGAVMAPVPSSSLRVMVQPIGEKSKTEPYDVTYGAITNFGFLSAGALASLEELGKWGDVEDVNWPALIEESITHGTGDTHLCTRLLEIGWKIRADPRLLCNHAKIARIQSDRPKTQIGFNLAPPPGLESS